MPRIIIPHRFVAFLLILVVLLVALPLQARTMPITDAQRLQQAWRMATAIGRFHYQTAARQSTHPTVSLKNAGRQVKTKQFRVEGEINLPQRQMKLQLHSGQGSQARVTELKVEDGQAFGRLDAHAEWTPLDQSTDLFAPGGDPLGFLAAAENIQSERFSEQSLDLPISQSPNDLLEQALPPAYLATLTRYTFDLNGVKYAEYMRVQMEEALRRKGELPNKVNLAPVRAYVDMTGRGEIWVNAEGLPVRQVIQMHFPPEKGAGEWVEAAIATNFRNWQPDASSAISQFWQAPTLLLNDPLAAVGVTPQALQRFSLLLGFTLLLVGFATLLIRYRRSSRLYGALAASIIGSMVVIPLLDAQQIYAFSERQQIKANTQSAEKAAQDQLEAAQNDQSGRTFNPELNPLEVDYATRNTNHESRGGLQGANYESPNHPIAQSPLSSTCDLALDTDCDDDGLSNEAEIYKLGTSPYAVDSDGDYISDATEVKGFTFNGKRWYLDPLNPDSNGDGQLDSLECPGLNDINATTGMLDATYSLTACQNSDAAGTNSDTTPDVFDFDNDGDGVPDKVDGAPYSVVGNTSSGLTEGKLDFNLNFTGAAKPIFVDFTVRPTNADHLWQSYNVLDWPTNDSEGQITRVHDTTYADLDSYSSVTNADNGDMMLIPLLEFEITYDAANPAAGLPISGTYDAVGIHDFSDLAWLDRAALDELGISVNQGETDQSLLLWVPLSLMQDEVGDTPVAWQGRMLYRPLAGLNNLGHDQTVRLIWMVQALTDSCDAANASTSSASGLTSAELVEAWCADQANWTTKASVIQTYYEDFYLTSLNVREDHGAKVAIIAEPANVGNTNYDDQLWHLADTLQSALIGAQAKSNGDRFTVSDIGAYLSTWGVGDLAVSNYTLANELALAKVASTYSTDALNQSFTGASQGASATLLFAGEERARLGGLSDGGAISNGNRVVLDLASKPLKTLAALRWAPYTYQGAGVWNSLDVATYLEQLERTSGVPNLPLVFTNSQLDLLVAGETISDYAQVRAGAVQLAQSYYLALHLGLTQVVAENGQRFGAATLGNYTLGSTQPATTIVAGLVDEIQGYYANLSLVKALTTSTSPTITTANSLAASFAVSFSAILEALGTAAQGTASSALTLALGELRDYYKTASLSTSKFTNVTGLTALAWASTATYFANLDLNAVGVDWGDVVGVTYTAALVAYAIHEVKGAIAASIAYNTAIARAQFAALQPNGATTALTYAADAGDVVKSNLKWSVILLVISIAIAWTIFAVGTYQNDLQRHAAIAQAVADTIVAVIMAVIGAIPVAGWIIMAVVGLISGLMMAACAIYNAAADKNIAAGGDVDRFVCNGLSGTLSTALVYAIYDQYIVADLNDADRLDIVMKAPILTQKVRDNGYIVGNEIALGAAITNTITQAEFNGLGAATADTFGWDVEDLLQKSTFVYTLQTSATDHESGLSAGEVAWDKIRGGDFPQYRANLTADYALPLRTAGINQSTHLYLTESFRLPTLECWGFLVQGCSHNDYADSTHMDLGDDFIFDVLPATFDGFLALRAGKQGGYYQAWDARFPALQDADGDGLLSKKYAGADPNDSTWDADGDGLSDFWELENRFNPTVSDYDNDGLSDYWEAFYQTNPLLADSDNDGLTDDKEFFHANTPNAYVKDNSLWTGGWTIVYGYNGATRLQTLVTADPNDSDSDDDTILDRHEFIYGYNPNLPSVRNVLSLDAQVSDSVVAPGATFGYTATVKNELDNRVANGLLQAEFPVDTVQKTQVIGTLLPNAAATLNGSLTAPTVSATTAASVTIRAGAIIEDVNTGRALWLHMNEAANATAFADDAQSDNGPHNATCVSASAACPSANGSYLTFDGANDRLTIPHDNELNLNIFTLSLWVKQDVSRAQSLFAKGTTGLNLSVDAAGKLRVAFNRGDCSTAVSLLSTSVLAVGSWQNVVVAANGSTLALYFNGVQQASTNVGSVCANNSPITLGSNSSGNYLDGALDEVELYTDGKTAEEVATLSQKPVFYSSSYRVVPNTTYARPDESDYSAATIHCETNATTDFDCPVEEPGIAGDAFVFNQQHGLKVTGSDVTDLSALNDTFSMSLWVYPEQGYTPDDEHLNHFGQLILGNDEAGYNKAYPSLYIKERHLIMRFGHAAGNGYCEATVDYFFDFDRWQYVTVVFDGTQFNVYKNGALKNRVTGTNCAGKQLYPEADFYIGNGRSAALYFTQFETDNDPINDEGFLWSEDTQRDNGYGAPELVWESAWHDLDSNDTLAINEWAVNTKPTLSYSMCNADQNPAEQGCHGDNEYFTLNGSSERVRTVNFYDPLGIMTRERWHNAHGDGSGDARTWDGYLTYKLYNDGFKGKLDEIKIYRTVLNDAAISTAYASSVRSLTLTFDEAPGQDIFRDHSGNDYNGNCAALACPDSGIPGRDNQAARFDGGVADDDGNDGVADYITLDNAQKLGIKDGSFTVLAWIKPDTISGLDTVLGADAGATNNGLGLLLNNGKPTFSFVNNDTASATTLATGKWTHLAWRYDKNAQEQAIFINGVLDVAQTGKPPMTGATLVRVGRARFDNYFDGLIDQVVIVKDALTTAEIQAIMHEAPLLNLHLDEDLATTTFTNDSPISASPTCVGTACPTAGSKGQVREAPIFDGNDLLTTNITGTVSNARKISVGLWVKPAQQKNSAQFLFKSGPVNLFLQPNSSTLGVETGYYHYCGFDNSADFTAGLLANQWNHVMVTLNEIPGSHDTYPSVKVAVYINGVYVTGGNKAIACTKVSTISLGQNFEGSLDEVVFYDSVLSAETVAAHYEYQSTWYDLSYQQLVTVDVDAPLAEIALDADYLSYASHWLTINALDASSRVQSVAIQLTRPDGTLVTSSAIQSDGSVNSGAWLYEFIPSGEGDYTLQATVTDQVGNRTIVSRTFGVDSRAPEIALHEGDDTLTTSSTDDDSAFSSVARNRSLAFSPLAAESADRVLALTGVVSDVNGLTNSGVNTPTVAIYLYDWQGAAVEGARDADLTINPDGTLGEWAVDYPFNVAAYGVYTVAAYIADNVGNFLTTTVGTVTVDDYGPTGDIALTSRVISEAVGTLEGVITDIPYATAGKLLHLHFEEHSGASEFSDSARGHFTATCPSPSAGTGNPACPSTSSGHAGRAVSFDGSNDLLTIANQIDLEPGAMTLLAWVKPGWNAGAKGYNPNILGMGDSPSSGYRWQLADNYGSMIFDNGSTTQALPMNLAANTWQHLALVHDGVTWTGYVDGIPVGVITQSVGSLAGLDLHIGAATSSAGFFQGLLDEVAIYNRALSSKELYDIAHPLATAVTTAEIRFRHAKDGDQGEIEGDWLPLTFADPGTANYVTWQYPLPSGLEGPYKIDLKAVDQIGNASYIPNVWFGEIDTVAPTLHFTYTVLGNGYTQVGCTVADYNLNKNGVSCPLLPLTEVYEARDWFTDRFGVYTKTVALTSDPQTVAASGSTDPVTFTACDLLGHCVAQTITPTVPSDVSAILSPGAANSYTTLAPLTLAGFAASNSEVRSVVVTINDTVIYSTTYTSGITNTTWSTDWTPRAGTYRVEATMTNGLGQQISDPVATVLTFVAPNLTIRKSVTPTSGLRAGDPITYTVVVGNNGSAAASGVILTDTLPAAVSGTGLNRTVDLAVGEMLTYTMPATVLASTNGIVTNTATISHTWQREQSSASFIRCDDSLVTNANDSGPGSLRQAISDACTNDAVIRFADDYQIYLNSTLAINKSLTIDGTGRAITVSGDAGNDGTRNVRVFNIGASGVVTLTHLTVVSGTAPSGGGIGNDGVLTILDSHFTDNYATNGAVGGGAIYTNKVLTVLRSTFVDNQAARFGGAIFVRGRAEVRNSTLTGNRAPDGSGIRNSGVLTLTNVTAVAGGSLYNWFGRAHLYNSIIANNAQPDCTNYTNGTVAGNINNLIETGNCITPTTSAQGLGAFGDYGGATHTIPLLPGSPALHGGDTATCEPTDQRGLARVGRCDIGAFESQGFTLTLTAGDNQRTLIGTPFGQGLGFTVAARASREPISGGMVRLLVPSSGASLGDTRNLPIDSTGVVSATVFANQLVGGYAVTATVGAPDNNPVLTFANLSPDLTIRQTMTPTAVVGGDLITYTLAFANEGDLSAGNVTITDILPSAVSVQQVISSGDVSVTRSSDAGTEIFTIADLAVGQAGLITLTGKLSPTVTTGELLVNRATIGWPQNEAEMSNNQSAVSPTIPCQGAIIVTNGNDRGAGSLRQALANLCAGGTITFAGDTTIYLDSLLALDKTLTIDGGSHAVTVSGDSGHDGDPDVQLFNISASGVVTLSNLSVVSGTAPLGGGIYNAGTLTLHALTLADHVGRDNGGALYNVGRATVDQTTVANNQSVNNGTIYNGGMLTVTHSTLAANHARRGGGIYNATSHATTVMNSTFGGNRAQEGGGIHNRGLLTVTNSTFAENSGYGSSIHNWNGTLQLVNSLLTGTCINQGTLAVSINNFVTDGGCGAVYSGTAYLSRLGDYGGPSTSAGPARQTFALLPGSPAIDRGDAAYCETTDQRGLGRKGTCDIGAFESQGFTLHYAGGSNQAAAALATFSTPLALTITANADNEPVAGGGILFTAPASGPSLSPTSITGRTTADGAAITVMANRVVGSYVVTATANGVTATAPITFALTNNVCDGVIVRNTNDRGVGSLRQAIDTVCTDGVITFDQDYTIHLSSTLALSRAVTIDGTGHQIIVSGDRNGDGSPDVQPFSIGASGIVTLTQLSVMNGTANNGSALANRGTLVLDTVTLANNDASASGTTNLGTLYNEGTLTVKNSTFAHNESYRGGGIYHATGTAHVVNSTFADNIASEGGGIYNHSALTVINSTFSNNSSSSGESYVNKGTLALINTLHNGKSLTISNCQGNTPVQRSNNRSNDTTCGSDAISFSLQVLGLGDYGGTATGTATTVATAAIQGGSSAINAGNVTYCPTRDQRGRPRLGRCDIGAVEWQGYRLAGSGGDSQRAGLNNGFAAPLQVTMTAVESFDSVPSGQTIYFNAPGAGASLSTPTFSVTTNSSKVGSATVSANGINGTYLVTATASTVITPLLFTLTNDCRGAVVTNANDTGYGSLRQALNDICPGGTITFAEDQTIYLESTLVVSKTATIDGRGHAITVSGDSGNDGDRDVRVFAIGAGGVVTLSHLSLVSGTVASEQGAGILNDGVLTLLASTVADNRVTGAGAGAGLANNGTLMIVNSSLIDNAAADGSGGGGLTNGGTATIVNSTFSGNTTATAGGAIHNTSALTITNGTLAGNGAAGSGSGIYNSGALALRNTISANSTTGSDCVDVGTLVSNSHNLIEDNSCNPAHSGDPWLSNLGNYGGETATFALLPGSLALDGGAAATCPATDQRGESRVGICDLGATEAQGFAMILRSGNQQSANHDANFAQPLQVSLVASDTNLSLSDQVITFTAPITGATLANHEFTLVTDESGTVAAAVTANRGVGTYGVVATAFGFTTPVTFTLTNLDCYAQLVTNANDSGPGSLRWAVADACDTGAITFADDYTIYLNSTITTSKNITISGADHAITVSGDSDNDGSNDVRPFQIEAAGVVTMLDLRIVNGNATGFDLNGRGGAILNQGMLTLAGMTLANNQSNNDGGALANYGTLALNDSTLQNNRTDNYGGGLFNASGATLTILNSEVISNSSQHGAGVFSEGAFTVAKTLIAENGASTSSGMGGGIVSFGDTAITESTIISNAAAMGGGLLVSGGAAVISHTIFADNLATDEGGAISSDSSLTLVNSTINRNRVESSNPDPADYIQGGGGISSIGRDTLINSTISGNTATINGVGANGGGLLHAGAPGELDPQASTLTLVNTIIANNSAGGDCVVIDGAPVDDLGHNLIGDGAAVGDGGCVGNATTFSGEPWLAPWGYYGGESPTNALLPNSPAINGGDAAYCPLVDQRGLARFGVCDIGAFESQGFTLTLSGGDNQSTQINQPFATPLQVTVHANDPNVAVGADQLVSFSAPNSPAWASLVTSSFTATTDSTGLATISVTANAIIGTYGVTATVNNGVNDLTFALRNRRHNNAPAFAVVADQMISETFTLDFAIAAVDPDNDALTFALLDAPPGAAIVGESGRFTWTPTFDQGPGRYPITVTVTDNDAPALSDRTVFTVTVLDLPLTYDQAVATAEGQALTIELLVASANASLTYSYTVPSHGLLSGVAPNLIYTPFDDYVGSDSFTFFISDGILTSTVATVAITVNPVNRAPTATGQAVSAAEETALPITLEAQDEDSDPLTYTVTSAVRNGLLGGLAPNLIYTPTVDFVGEDHFGFIVSDGLLDSDAVTVTITVNAVDDTPTAQGQQISTAEETPRAITLQGSDVDSDLLTYRIVATPDHGELGGIAPNLIYTPATNFTGADALLFNIDDGTSNSATARVAISVTAVNDPPQADSDTLTTAEDESVALLLWADDPEADALSYVVITPPQHGVLGGIAPNLLYTPTANYHGSDALTFKANDGAADSPTATLSITVAPRNDAPTVADQSINSTEDAVVEIILNGADLDGDELTYVVVDAPTHGTVGGVAPRLFYTPTADYQGNDSFTVVANDGTADGVPATVALTITAVNDQPRALPQTLNADEDQSVAITLAGSDVDGDALTFALVTPPAHGVLDGIAPDLIYTPHPDFHGDDAFTFTVNDGTADPTTARISITVAAVNDLPLAAAQAITTSEEMTVAITLTPSDADGDALTYLVGTLRRGTLAGNAPHLIYTPAADFAGTDLFTYTVNDGNDSALTVPITLTVMPIDDAPRAVNQAVTTSEDQGVALTLRGVDVDSHSLTYTVATPPQQGTLTGVPPQVIYTPKANYHGPDVFTFMVSDGVNPAPTATVTITVAAVNDRPLAATQAVAISEEQPISLTLTGSDADSDALTYMVLAQPAHGTLGGIAPALRYTPTADFSGTDRFTFGVSDGISDSLAAVVTVTVEPVNDAPLAAGQNVTTTEDNAVAITLSAADRDADPLNYLLLSQPQHGILRGLAPTLIYTPSANFAGSDAFQFSVTDGTTNAAPMTVTLTVAPVADAPVANHQVHQTEQGRPFTITLMATDIDSTVLTYTITTHPSHGSVGAMMPTPMGQSLIYTPAGSYLGNDAIGFLVSDGTLTATATISITITERNQPPLAYPATITTVAESTVNITLRATDPDGDPLTYAMLAQPAAGTLRGVLPNLVYAPADGFSGFDHFTFQVSDGRSQAAAAISITVQSLSATPTPTATVTATPTPTAQTVATATPTATATNSAAATQTPTPTATANSAPTNTATATALALPTNTSTATITPTPTVVAATMTPTPTLTATTVTAPTNTATATATGVSAPTTTPSATATPTAAATSPAMTTTPTATATATSTVVNATLTPTPTTTAVSTPTSVPTATLTPTPTAVAVTTTPSPTATTVSGPTMTPTVTATTVVTATSTPTATGTTGMTNTPTATSTPTLGVIATDTPAATGTATESALPTNTPPSTPTVRPTVTAPAPLTATTTSTATATPTVALTTAPTAMTTSTATATPTLTPTTTQLPTATTTALTATSTATEMALPTATPTPILPVTATVSPTVTAMPTVSATATATAPPISTATATTTSTATLLATPTATATATALPATSTPMPTAIATATAITEPGLPTPTATLLPTDPIALDLALTLGIGGIEPQCTDRAQFKVPRETAVVYCYTVHNQTPLTQTIHTLTDSHWGLLLDRAPLLLGPGQSYQYVISHTVTAGTTHVASWMAEPQLQLLARRALGASKDLTLRLPTRRPWLTLVNRWRDAVDLLTNPVLVEVSTDADDQDGDNIPDNLERAADLDRDNIPNFLDADADGDGAPDLWEGTADRDRDERPDYLDPDTWPLEPTGIDQLYLPMIMR